MATGNRALKIQELKDAISDCIVRKRQALSDGENSCAALARAVGYEEQAARFLKMAEELRQNVFNYRDRIAAEEKRIAELRVELEAVRKEDAVASISRVIKELEGLDSATLEVLASEHPEMLLLLKLKGGK